MNISSEINSIVKIKKIKTGLSNLTQQNDRLSESTIISAEPSDQPGALVPPLTLDVLTYDDTKDVTFTDTSGTDYTIKTAATAKITDANGVEYLIDVINYA